MKVFSKCVVMISSLALISMVTGCDREKSNKDTWAKDELLTEVYSLKQEMVALRSDVASLSDKIDSLPTKSAANAAPTPAPQGVIPKAVKIPPHSLMGDEKAKVAIIEFTDFQCPFCARHAKTVLPEIKKTYVDTGKVQYAIADFPLVFHQQARNGAIAARCAGKQDHYWAIHDQMFFKPQQLRDGDFKGMAEELGLNSADFSECLNDKSIAKAVDDSVALGSSYGVSGTPKFFIGKVQGNTI